MDLIDADEVRVKPPVHRVEIVTDGDDDLWGIEVLGLDEHRESLWWWGIDTVDLPGSLTALVPALQLIAADDMSLAYRAVHLDFREAYYHLAKDVAAAAARVRDPHPPRHERALSLRGCSDEDFWLFELGIDTLVFFMAELPDPASDTRRLTQKNLLSLEHDFDRRRTRKRAAAGGNGPPYLSVLRAQVPHRPQKSRFRIGRGV